LLEEGITRGVADEVEAGGRPWAHWPTGWGTAAAEGFDCYAIGRNRRPQKRARGLTLEAALEFAAGCGAGFRRLSIRGTGRRGMTPEIGSSRDRLDAGESHCVELAWIDRAVRWSDSGRTRGSRALDEGRVRSRQVASDLSTRVYTSEQFTREDERVETGSILEKPSGFCSSLISAGRDREARRSFWRRAASDEDGFVSRRCRRPSGKMFNGRRGSSPVARRGEALGDEVASGKGICRPACGSTVCRRQDRTSPEYQCPVHYCV